MSKGSIFNMRVNRMAYFLELVKKKFIESGYSRKNLFPWGKYPAPWGG
jgi:hypothetical protein